MEVIERHPFAGKKPNSEDSARVDFSDFLAERLPVQLELDKESNTCLIS